MGAFAREARVIPDGGEELAEHLLGSGNELDLQALAGEHPECAGELLELGSMFNRVLAAFSEGRRSDKESLHRWQQSHGAVEGESPGHDTVVDGTSDLRPPSGEDSKPFQPSSSFPSESFLARFRVRRAIHDRYTIQEQVARGGDLAGVLKACDAVGFAHSREVLNYPDG